MQIRTLGIDVAQQVFQLHGVDKRGHVVLTTRLSRAKVLPFVAQLPPCLIGMEASGGAHDWARELTKRGHTVKRMSPQCVRPSGQRQNNDMHDAAGICEAVSRPQMRFVPLTSVEQQDIQALHRIRERQIKARTALVNQLRGLLSEHGIVIPQGVARVRQALPARLADAENGLTWEAREW
jgi:transposase